MPRLSRFLILIGALATPSIALAQSQGEGPGVLIAAKVENAPKIDGNANDAEWSRAKPYVTYDPLAKVKLTIRAVYTDDSIFVLATFPDKTENRNHKTQVWVPDQSRYRIGTDREDTFVVKWSMEAGPVDLRVDADKQYKADIWFWKAHRTDQAGFADDKMHIYSPFQMPNSTSVISKNGMRFFLRRPGDSGRAAYKTMIHSANIGDRTPLYRPAAPQGSRADVRAKGTWRDGAWTVEFARKLATGNSDDVQFDVRRSYAFGVSRFEIAGRKKNPELEEPYFGAGEITEILALRFE